MSNRSRISSSSRRSLVQCSLKKVIKRSRAGHCLPAPGAPEAAALAAEVAPPSLFASQGLGSAVEAVAFWNLEASVDKLFGMSFMLGGRQFLSFASMLDTSKNDCGYDSVAFPEGCASDVEAAAEVFIVTAPFALEVSCVEGIGLACVIVEGRPIV